MGNVVLLYEPSDYRWAQRRIKRLWDEGNFILHPHARRRMAERELDALDIQYIIRYGQITEHSKPECLWRYKVQGKALDGRKASVLVEIDIHSLIVVTVLGRRASR
jgi:hypothetical protein